MSEKPITWLGSSLADLRGFPDVARRAVGHELGKVQLGREPSDWKPMPTVGRGVREIRIHVSGEYRVLFIAELPEAVYVLHAFEKKTRKTRRADIDLARRRLRLIGRR